jgi:hypothetical protein
VVNRQNPDQNGALGPGDPLEQRVAQAMAELEAAEAAVAQAEARMRDFSTVVVSRDGSVEVTVGPQGELTDLKFLDGKYRSMSAPQLAAAVLAAAEEGRNRAAEEAVRVFRPLTEPSKGIPELSGLDVDWDRLLGRRDDAGAGRATPWQSANARLRDEISEDDEEGPLR